MQSELDVGSLSDADRAIVEEATGIIEQNRTEMTA